MYWFTSVVYTGTRTGGGPNFCFLSRGLSTCRGLKFDWGGGSLNPHSPPECAFDLLEILRALIWRPRSLNPTHPVLNLWRKNISSVGFKIFLYLICVGLTGFHQPSGSLTSWDAALDTFRAWKEGIRWRRSLLHTFPVVPNIVLILMVELN